jgi:hypothetical protein
LEEADGKEPVLILATVTFGTVFLTEWRWGYGLWLLPDFHAEAEH